MEFRRKLGNRGESEAAKYLEEKGYQILARQFRTPIGEIDLVAIDGDEVVFVEVKSRRTSTYGYPEEAVTPTKIQHMMRAVQRFLQQSDYQDACWRIDVISIEYYENPTKITHLIAVGD